MQTDRSELYDDSLVKRLLTSLEDWETEVLKQHNKPDLGMHRLCLLADMGVRAEDEEMKPVIERILGTFGTDGLPRFNILLPKVFRGSGEVEEVWTICDYPQLLYSLMKMGVADARIDHSVKYLSRLYRENGYPCTSSMENFRGPGSKKEFCPIASLYALKALNRDSKIAESEAAASAAESLLRHWEQRGEKKYYLFGIGTDFRKLKYPMIWYNILHFLSVLSDSKNGCKDPRTLEIAEVLLEKADDELRFTPESMYRYYKEEDFADKKNPSQTITLSALEILIKLKMVKV